MSKKTESKTVKVTFLKSPKGFGYSAPKTYDLPEDEAKKFTKEGVAVTSTKVLPDEFPAREILIAAGFETVADVKKASEGKHFNESKIPNLTGAKASAVRIYLKRISLA